MEVSGTKIVLALYSFILLFVLLFYQLTNLSGGGRSAPVEFEVEDLSVEDYYWDNSTNLSSSSSSAEVTTESRTTIDYKKFVFE